jgi:fucose 4-O-acetylase-like acetyltransferase
MSKEIKWITTAKGIGIFLVVLGHVNRGLNNANIYNQNSFYEIDYLIYTFHMPLFFFLAGIFFLKSLDKRGFKIFSLDKINLLLYLYIIWSIIQFVIQLILNNYINGSISYSDILYVFVQPKGQMWFLYVLLLIFIINAAIFSVIKTNINRNYLIVFLVMCSIFL